MKPIPHLLLVEDDPTSRAFLAAALRRLPAHVDTATSLGEAIARTRDRAYAAWLVDAHLPDGSGCGLLAALRVSGADGVALAHTASTDAALHARLRDAGFGTVLVKPLSAEALLDAVRRALDPAPVQRRHRGGPHSAVPASTTADMPVWDTEAAARAVGGQQAHVVALRGLFLAELPGIRERIREAVRHADATTLRAELHRLHASCGFVGAARVAAAARALQDDSHPGHLRRFEAAVDATLEPADR